MNWIPRFVGPDFVVMPEEINNLWRTPDGKWFADRYNRDTVSLDKVRRDRPTGMTDRNGTAIFENDILQWDGDSNERVVFDYGEFIMRTGKSGPDCPLWKEAENAEVVGMVAYGEE